MRRRLVDLQRPRLLQPLLLKLATRSMVKEGVDSQRVMVGISVPYLEPFLHPHLEHLAILSVGAFRPPMLFGGLEVSQH